MTKFMEDFLEVDVHYNWVEHLVGDESSLLPETRMVEYWVPTAATKAKGKAKGMAAEVDVAAGEGGEPERGVAVEEGRMERLEEGHKRVCGAKSKSLLGGLLPWFNPGFQWWLRDLLGSPWLWGTGGAAGEDRVLLHMPDLPVPLAKKYGHDGRGIYSERHFDELEQNGLVPSPSPLPTKNGGMDRLADLKRVEVVDGWRVKDCPKAAESNVGVTAVEVAAPSVVAAVAAVGEEVAEVKAEAEVEAEAVEVTINVEAASRKFSTGIVSDGHNADGCCEMATEKEEEKLKRTRQNKWRRERREQIELGC
mmetsp:Transcript_73894/g.196828  ORF Transcript_73894/g.196828 Transcript_73894/m.196828 type:complete len:308 (-) Transcript_73894:151-1074(-)